MSIVVGGIGFNNATPAPGGGGITGATNGLKVIGSYVGLGGPLTEIGTDITASTSQSVRIIPNLATYQGALLVLGPVDNVYGSAYFNVIGDHTGIFQQKAMFISDHSAGPGEGFHFYYDTVNNALQMESVGGANPTFNVANANLVVGSNQSVLGGNIEIAGNGGAASIIMGDQATFNFLAMQLNTGSNLLLFYNQNSSGIGEFRLENLFINAEYYTQTSSADNNFSGTGGSTLIGPALSATAKLIVGSPTPATIPQLSLQDANFGSDEMNISFDADAATMTFDPDPTELAYLFNGGGIVPPKMTQAQRTAQTNLVIGMIVYQTDGTEGIYVFKSGGWQFVA